MDLLEERRQEIGLRPAGFISQSRFNRKGLFFAASLIGSVISISIYTFSNTIRYELEKRSLANYVKKHSELKKTIAKRSDKIKTTKKFNIKLASSIAGGNSSSALLTEIRLRIPKSMQLKSITETGNKLNFEGLAIEPNGLNTINMFLLHLEDSPFITPRSTKLVAAKETMKENTQSIQGITNFSKYKVIDFEITTLISSESSKLNRERLQVLGSAGLARRIEILEKEGLLK